MFGMSVEYVGIYVPVKFGDSTCNHSGDIRATHFVTDDEQRQMWVMIQGKTPFGILP